MKRPKNRLFTKKKRGSNTNSVEESDKKSNNSDDLKNSNFSFQLSFFL